MILIVVPPKRVDLLLRVLERREPMHVQTFLPEPPVERFDGGVVRGLAAPAGGMSVSDAKRLKELKIENGRLKRLLAESLLERDDPRSAANKIVATSRDPLSPLLLAPAASSPPRPSSPETDTPSGQLRTCLAPGRRAVCISLPAGSGTSPCWTTTTNSGHDSGIWWAIRWPRPCHAACRALRCRAGAGPNRANTSVRGHRGPEADRRRISVRLRLGRD